MNNQRLVILILMICLCHPVYTFAETIILKSGRTVEGKIIERTGQYVKVKIENIEPPLTYFLDNIQSIDGQEIRGESDDAIQVKEISIQDITPEMKKAFADYVDYINNGLEFALQERFKDAEGQFEKALNMGTEIVGSNVNVQIFLETLKDLNKGIVNKDSVLYLFKGIKNSGENPKELISGMKKALQINPNYANYYYILGSAFGLGQSEEAIINLKKALEINPDFAEAYTQLGSIYGLLNRDKESKEVLQKAKELFKKKGDHYRMQEIDRLSKAKLSANEAAAKATAKTIATALESYALENNGNYPTDEFELVSSKNPYLFRVYNNNTVSGYIYSLKLNPNAYQIIAKPEKCGETGKKIFISETGNISERECE